MRECGYYWIKAHDNDYWEIGQWDGNGWSVCGSEVQLYDAAPLDAWGVVAVGERIPDHA